MKSKFDSCFTEMFAVARRVAEKDARKAKSPWYSEYSPTKDGREINREYQRQFAEVTAMKLQRTKERA